MAARERAEADLAQRTMSFVRKASGRSCAPPAAGAHACAPGGACVMCDGGG